MRIATALLTVLLLFPLSCQAEETESNHTPSSSTKSTSAPEEPSEPAEGAPVDTAQSEEVEVSEVEAILNDNSINQLGWDRSRANKALAKVDGAQGALEAIATDKSRDDALRYKASEALYAQGGSLSSDEDKADIARLYAQTLGSATEHDVWGLPSQSPTGPGKRIVALGKPALLELRPLLDNGTTLLLEGSEEPTIAEMRGYRVADLAGRYASEILGVSFDVENDSPAARDADLKKIAEAIDSQSP